MEKEKAFEGEREWKFQENVYLDTRKWSLESLTGNNRFFFNGGVKGNYFNLTNLSEYPIFAIYIHSYRSLELSYSFFRKGSHH